MEKIFDRERELDIWCKLIFDYTKERVENDSVATRWIFDRATHDEWVLSLFPKHLASVDAYNQFYELTGKDIRDFNWNSKVKTKSGENIIVHQYFVDEHMTTAHDFKYELIHLYRNGELSIDKIKELISMQRLCWITKDENDELNRNGFRNHRSNPLEAYDSCGIKIYEQNVENLKLMVPTFLQNARCDASQSNEILCKLQNYFNNNTIYDTKFTLSSIAGESYAWIYKMNDYMINVRVKKGLLKDINLFISGSKAKERFEKLQIFKSSIEKELGYELVWDENKEKKATRIGRFFKNAELNTDFEIKNKDICFDFNIEDFDYIQKVAIELVNFYEVFFRAINRVKRFEIKKRHKNLPKLMAEYFEDPEE